MDMTQSITPKSDQWNADDLVSRSVTVTIESVVKGSAEQPVDVRLVETPGKAYRPSKSMRRVMVEAWGIESSAYTGHQLTLFRNPKIRFGGMVVGGIEISHMSHIDRPMTIALTRSKGKREAFTVAPMPDVAPKATGPLTERTRAQLFALLTEAGVTDADSQRKGMSAILGRPIASRSDLTEDDARAVILDLQARAS